jgi:hypothetical protein
MNCIIIHGCNPKDKIKVEQEGFPPQNERHWFPWLKKELEEKEILTETPLMPKNWKPLYSEWKNELEKLDINEETILIGHSCGGGFLVRWIGDTKRKIRKLILVAPAIAHSDYLGPFDDLMKFEVDSNLCNLVRDIIIFVSDNERDSIKESVKIFSKKFGVEPIILKDKGHFLEKHIGTKEFPELLKKVLE